MNQKNTMEEKRYNMFQNKRLFAVILFLIILCILIIGAKIAVEQSVKNQLVLVGEQLTGRKFETDSVTYHPLFFDLVITGLKMKNPPGYSLENPAVEIKKIHVRIAPWAILSRLVHIRKLDIKGVSFYPEIKLTVDKKQLVSIIMFRPWWQMWKMLNIEINLVDLSASPAASSKETADPSLWFLRIDDLEISDVTVYSPDVKAVKKYLPWINNLPSAWEAKNVYRQAGLGSDGKHTGTMIVKEILYRHINIIKIQKVILSCWDANKVAAKAWFEAKKKQYQQEMEKLKAQYEENKAKLEAWSEEQKPKLKAQYEEQKAKLKAQYAENKAKLDAWSEKQKPKLKAKYEEQAAKLKAQYAENKAKLDAWSEKQKPKLKAKYEEQAARLKSWYKQKTNAIYVKYSQDNQAEDIETSEANILPGPDEPVITDDPAFTFEGTVLE